MNAIEAAAPNVQREQSTAHFRTVSQGLYVSEEIKEMKN